ncbi:hypothetical protein H671_2g6330 [Cricetulus griseus]|uniref:Uncharacterized protein n=1 Tax=Cricetulus griseus TaxID=10029 RepID=A0A061IDF4_CRIGR|nr:hypothetical protein H671_2g6330 [Cricetulus griseus]
MAFYNVHTVTALHEKGHDESAPQPSCIPSYRSGPAGTFLAYGLWCPIPLWMLGINSNSSMEVPVWLSFTLQYLVDFDTYSLNGLVCFTGVPEVNKIGISEFLGQDNSEASLQNSSV